MLGTRLLNEDKYMLKPTISYRALCIICLFLFNSCLLAADTCISGNCENGQGTLIYDNGHYKYTGGFKDGKREGFGIVSDTEENARFQSFEGEFHEGDNIGGQGTINYRGYKYVGGLKYGVANGQGIISYADGAKIIGEFEDDWIIGEGTFFFSNDAKYVGGLRGKVSTYIVRHGQGTTIWSDGTKYVGEYKEGARNGQGTNTFPVGGKYLKYDGIFKNDAMKTGTLFYANGNKKYIENPTDIPTDLFPEETDTAQSTNNDSSAATLGKALAVGAAVAIGAAILNNRNSTSNSEEHQNGSERSKRLEECNSCYLNCSYNWDSSMRRQCELSCISKGC